MYRNELLGQYLLIQQALEANGGEITLEIEQALEEAEAELPIEVENIYRMIRDGEGEVALVTEEIARLSDRKDNAKDWVARLKAKLIKEFQAAGKLPKDRVFTPDGVHYAELRGNSVSVTGEIVEKHPHLLPVAFQSIHISANKIALKQAQAAGEPVPEGVEFVQNIGLKIK